MIGEENNTTAPTETSTEGVASDTAAPQSDAPKAEAQAQPTGGVADALRKAFNDYLEKSGAREQYGNEVNIDLEFLKNHAGPMFSSMFQQLTSNIVPKDMKIGVPIQSQDPTTSNRPVAVNFDLGGIIQSFFTPKKPAEPVATPAESAPKTDDSPKT